MGSRGTFKVCGDRPGEAAALSALGRVLAQARQFDDAINAYQSAAAIYRETGDQDSERIALDDLEAAKAERKA